MILNPAARVRILNGGQLIYYKASITAQGLLTFGVVHWVPEQPNILKGMQIDYWL